MLWHEFIAIWWLFYRCMIKCVTGMSMDFMFYILFCLLELKGPRQTYFKCTVFVMSWDKTSHMLPNIKLKKFAFFSENVKICPFFVFIKNKIFV